MAIVKLEPFFRFPRIFEEEDWEWPEFPATWSRRGLNVYETDKEVVVEAAIPGIPVEKVEVAVEDGVLKIHGAVEEKKEEKAKRKYYMESVASTASYAVRLPVKVDKKKIKAEAEDGLLKVVLPKEKPAPAKKVEVVPIRSKKAA
jgi:HSP20 family protein